MQPPANNDLDLRWFLPLFIGGWCAFEVSFSIISGWYALSQRYRSTHTVEGRLFPFASMKLGPRFFPVSYPLFVRLGLAGISLSIFPLFRICHPPLFIPWSAVSDCRRERHLFFMHTAVYVSEPKTRMLFAGRLGSAIYDSWSRDHAQPGRTV
jgi:hypothetical protein